MTLVSTVAAIIVITSIITTIISIVGILSTSSSTWCEITRGERFFTRLAIVACSVALATIVVYMVITAAHAIQVNCF